MAEEFTSLYWLDFPVFIDLRRLKIELYFRRVWLVKCGEGKICGPWATLKHLTLIFQWKPTVFFGNRSATQLQELNSSLLLNNSAGASQTTFMNTEDLLCEHGNNIWEAWNEAPFLRAFPTQPVPPTQPTLVWSHLHHDPIGKAMGVSAQLGWVVLQGYIWSRRLQGSRSLAFHGQVVELSPRSPQFRPLLSLV